MERLQAPWVRPLENWGMVGGDVGFAVAAEVLGSQVIKQIHIKLIYKNENLYPS
jgi:hypothetical protein